MNNGTTFFKPIRFSKKAIELAKKWQADSNIKMVYPCENIDQVYNDFQCQHTEIQRDADNKCIELFGMECEDLYELLKTGELTLSDIDNMNDYELSEKIDSTSSNDTMEDPLKEQYKIYAENKIRKELSARHENLNKIQWNYSYSPFFSPDEIKELSGYYSDTKNEQCDKIFEEYEKAFYGLENSFDPIVWDDAVRKLIYLKEITEDQSKIDQYNQSLVDIGWNPEITYNDNNRLNACNRINSMYSEQYKGVEIIDNKGLLEQFNVDDAIPLNESMKKGYYPISIILVKGETLFSDLTVKVTNGPFSHSAICLDNDFKRLYSFNMKADNKITSKYHNGMSLENIEYYPKDNILGIYTFFVDEEHYKSLNDNIQELLIHQNSTRYSVLNVLTLLIDQIDLNMNTRMICSQFVDKMLKLANIDITSMNSSKVTPNDFYRCIIKNSKIYRIYEGPVKDFDYNKAQKFVEKLSKKAKYVHEYVITKPTDWYTIPVITEARSIIRVNKDGDVILHKPPFMIDFDKEYNQSHMLLLNYDKTNDYEGMKYELCKLYYMVYLLETKRKKKDDKKIRDTRARILNDFNKYIKVVLRNQPNFNFNEYYEETPFYHNSLKIDADTVKYTTDQIKSLLLL